MSGSQQLEMPLIIEMARPLIRVRPDALEDSMIRGLSQQSGLSQADIVRRCVRVLSSEVDRLGSCQFLLPEVRRSPGTPIRRGRKPFALKRQELEQSISRSLRQLEQEQSELARLNEKRKGAG